MNSKNDQKIVFEDEFNIYSMIKRLWNNRILFVVIVSCFAIGSIIYSLAVTPVYEVTSMIQPADASKETTIKKTTPVMGFALTGYSHLPVINSIMITLKSDSFFELIYKKYENEERLFKDKLKNIEISDLDENEKEQMKRYEAIKTLRKAVKFNVNSDHNTIDLSVKLEDKYFAYELMNFLLESLRHYIRDHNISNLESDIEFYQTLLKKATDPTIKRIIDIKLTEKLERKFVLSYNVFTVVERPFIPARRVSPNRSMIVIITTLIGAFLSFMIVELKPVFIRIYKLIRE
ncbi:MAG: Wzz/FepE/Etk N-terminal domain-containing protein [Candidatus Delongbacteria bacterium]